MKEINIITMGKPTDNSKATLLDLARNSEVAAPTDLSVHEGRFGIWFFKFLVPESDVLFWQGVSAGIRLAISHIPLFAGEY